MLVRPVDNLLCSALIILLVFSSDAIKAETIPVNYQRIALEYQIPSSVLYGVALAESGKNIKSGRYKPWPWTLNVAGMPRRYPTRKAAYQGLQHYLSHGIKSIDIGFMQVNWRYHKKKLGTPWQALEPFHNIRAAAGILKGEYQKTGVWKTAIGRYHSPGQKKAQKQRAKRYAQRVIKHIDRLTGKKTSGHSI